MTTRVVLEIGSATIKGGIAGRHCPHFVVTTPAGLAGTDGAPTRMAYLEVLQRLFVDHLQLRPKECQVVVVEKMSASRAHRAMLLAVLLRDMQVQAATMQIDLCLTILAGAPGQTGLVVDIGERETRMMAVAHGRPIIQSLRIVDLGISHARQVFAASLLRHLALLGPLDCEQEAAVQSLFERATLASLPAAPAPPADLDVSAIGLLSPASFLLPGALRHEPLLVLLRGEAHGSSSSSSSPGTDVEILHTDGLAGALAESILSLNHDIRGPVLYHLVVTGGGGCVPGLAEALCLETSRLIVHRPRYARLVEGIRKLPEGTLQPAENAFAPAAAAWVGGSLFARLPDARYNSQYVTWKDILARSETSAAEGHENISVPDWMSLSDTDWRFSRPVCRE